MLRRVLVLALVAVASACVSHPVGPARTFGTYEGKARTTAASALSEVQTARLMATTWRDDRAFGRYTGSVLGDAEEALAGLSGTFGSIQPPGGEQADALRDDLTALLGDAQDHVAALRIATRRGERELDVTELDADVDALESFLAEHGG